MSSSYCRNDSCYLVTEVTKACADSLSHNCDGFNCQADLCLCPCHYSTFEAWNTELQRKKYEFDEIT